MLMAAHALKTLRGLSGAIQKQHYLQTLAPEEFKEVAQYALDPYKTYGIRQYEEPEILQLLHMENGVLWDRWKSLFDQLSARVLTGNAARHAVEQLLLVTPEDGRVVVKAVLDKHLDCGVGTTMLNKVWPNFIPVFKCQLAHSYEKHEKKVRWPMLVEVKHDGKRVLAIARAGEPVRLYSRNGHEDLGYAHVKEQLATIRDFAGCDLVFDGELMFGMFGDRKATEAEADFVLFDLLHWGEWVQQKTVRGQTARTDYIAELQFEMGHERWPDNINGPQSELMMDFESAMVKYREVIDNGGEGIMLKDPNALYQWKRTASWLKIKPEESEDLVVTGVFEGEGKYQGMLGGVIVQLPKTVVGVTGQRMTIPGQFVEVRVGSGFADHQRKHFWPNEQLAPSVQGQSESLIGRTVEVLYTEVTPDGSLRFPRFKCVRDDK